mgnify:CR=1 FL=1
MTDYGGIPIRNIFYMLAYAFKELRGSNYGRVATEDFNGVHDLFAEVLQIGISSLLKQGLHREYVLRSDTLVTLRGKLDVSGTIGVRMALRAALACEFDELSVDNTFNRILKSTSVLLLRSSEVGKARKAALRRLMPFFSEVGIIDLKLLKWGQLRYDRNSRVYQTLHTICYFIVTDLLPTTEAGGSHAPQFTDSNMALLFQRFIMAYYRRWHPELKARAKMIGWNISKDAPQSSLLPTMNTDVTLSFPSGRTLIIDAKYYSHTLQEHYGRLSIHSANIYQIHTYVTNEDKKHTGEVDGMLLYAMTTAYGAMSERMTLNDGNIIMFTTLDLSQDFESIKSQLEGIITYRHKA